MVGIRTSGSPEPVADGDRRNGTRSAYVVVTAGRFDILVELVCADRRAAARRDEPDARARRRRLDRGFLYLELWKQLYDWGRARREPCDRVGSS